MKRLISLALALVLALSVMALPAQAATITYNNSGIYQEQETNYTCTLASAAMMLRRRAIMNGATDWKKITEEAMRPTVWLENAGLYNSFSYAGMAVRSEGLSGSTSEKKQELIALLDKHPGGIVIYASSVPHAVFLTDYNPETDTFLCMDPAPSAKDERTALHKSTLGSYLGKTQNKVIAGITGYWYVKSSSYLIGSYVVDNNGKGIYLRSDATSSYTKLDSVPDGTRLTITAVTGKVGKTSYDGQTGWVSLAACEYKTRAYQIVYLKNGGSGSQMETTVCVYGQPTPLADCSYTKGDESFLGWFLYRPRNHTWLYTNGTSTTWCLEGEEPDGYEKRLMPAGSTILKGEARYGGQVYAYAQWGEVPVTPEPEPDPVPEPDEPVVEEVLPADPAEDGGDSGSGSMEVLPDVTVPDVPTTPDLPETGSPDVAVPDTPTLPDTDVPDTGAPDPVFPGASTPSTPAPGPSAPALSPSLSHFTHSIPYTPGQFLDVDEDKWYGSNQQGSVRAACELGLLKGTGGSGFSPESPVRIAQVVTMAARLHSIYYTGQDAFVQDPGDWFAVYMDYVLEQGILPASFLSDKQWALETNATRAQCAYILSSALPREALSQRHSWPAGSIPDVPASAQYSIQIYGLYEAGILTGGDDYGTFFYHSSIQRCEIAAIVARMADPTLRI